MSVSEAQRFELHRALQNLLGDDVSHTLMEHLPPSGWGDLARMRDIIEMEKRIDTRFERLNEQMNARFLVFEEHMNAHFAVVEGQIKGLNARINAVIGFGTALVLAILAIQTQLLISVANL